MIVYSVYLSDPKHLEFVQEVTELSVDELEDIVGRFTKRSQWAGELKGELCEMSDGTYRLRHHFNKKVLWKSTG